LDPRRLAQDRAEVLDARGAVLHLDDGDERGGGGGLEIRFDGRAFSKSELADPYACLFGGSAPGLRRNRHLAVGLLSSLRLNPTLVSVASGVRSRHRLRVWSPESETLEESPVPGRDTAVTVADGRAEHPEALAHVRACCGMVPIPVFIGDEELPRVEEAREGGPRPAVMEKVLTLYFRSEPLVLICSHRLQLLLN